MENNFHAKPIFCLFYSTDSTDNYKFNFELHDGCNCFSTTCVCSQKQIDTAFLSEYMCQCKACFISNCFKMSVTKETNCRSLALQISFSFTTASMHYATGRKHLMLLPQKQIMLWRKSNYQFQLHPPPISSDTIYPISSYLCVDLNQTLT